MYATPANRAANSLNQYISRDVPGAFDVLGLAMGNNSTLKVNSATPWHKAAVELVKHLCQAVFVNLILSFLIGLCLCWLCTGCSKTTNATYSEAMVRKVVVTGTTKETVEKAFGLPLVTMPIQQNGGTLAIYSLPEVGLPVAFQNKFTGFQIQYKGDRVEKWFPVYSDRSVSRTSENRQDLQARTNQSSTNLSEGISFYVVSDTKLDEGFHVDTSHLPEVGYIAKAPDLTIKKIESVIAGKEIVGAGTNQETPTLIIVLPENAAQSLRGFTEKQIGKRVVIAVDQTLLAAPYISTPNNNGQFSVSFHTQQARDDALLRLRTLVNEP